MIYGKAGDVAFQSVDFDDYPYDEALCHVVTLERYIRVTKEIRMSPRLFLVSMKSYRRVSKATGSRWTKIRNEKIWYRHFCL